VRRKKFKEQQRNLKDLDFSEFVPHPRYGAFPHLPDKKPATICAREEVRYRTEDVFPETRIAADPEKQHYVFPQTFYVDVLKRCLDCRRQFIFFAREQRYWYESLKFPTDADCVRCPECRAEQHELKRRFQRYSELAALENLEQKQLIELISDAIYLWRQGLLQNEQTSRKLRNRAMKSIPGHAVTGEIDALIGTL